MCSKDFLGDLLFKFAPKRALVEFFIKEDHKLKELQDLLEDKTQPKELIGKIHTIKYLANNNDPLTVAKQHAELLESTIKLMLRCDVCNSQQVINKTKILHYMCEFLESPLDKGVTLE